MGLLSRSLTLQSYSGSVSSRKGGHVRIMGEAGISGTSFYRLGQTNVIGAYSMHFHLGGNKPTSYVSDSSFYASFYRCVVIHSVSSVVVKDNVAFDIAGAVQEFLLRSCRVWPAADFGLQFCARRFTCAAVSCVGPQTLIN